ncbi:unnamed protein product [Aphis gossypii]|uniref:DDE Tnp4 domain-containing protein n=1 Tax=Aphis gossypii TaxID=80765 RepID=A0A9P0J6Z9_APHGO|nr:unnamed protein product [Aphis gossypii]
MGKKMLNNTLHFPKASAISKNNINIPYYIVADEAFPFNTYMMRPQDVENQNFLSKKQFLTIGILYMIYNNFISNLVF